jgi:FG-GAP-like repeat/Dockerin type I domain
MKRMATAGGTLAAVLALTLAAGGSAAAQTFRAAPLYSVGGASGEAVNILVAADITSNNPPYTPDGIPDLITAAQNSQVSVLAGNGDGTFASAPSTSIQGTIAAALAVADFDGDGVADLLVADAQNVKFVKGNNDGTFASPGPPIAVGQNLVAVVAADLNGDHRMDAIALDGGVSGIGGVTVLLGNGDGTFTKTAQSPIATALGADALVAADFTGDGTLDLAVANAGDDSVSVLAGTGGGSFAAPQRVALNINPAPDRLSIAAGDLNGDGRQDLVLAVSNADEVAVLTGLGGGSFSAPKFYPSGTMESSPNAVAVADLNGDGHPDVVVSNKLSFDAGVLLGDGTGHLGAARSFVTDQEPLTVIARDLNGDGIPDVATLNRGQNNSDVAVLLGRGDGSLAGVEDVAVAAEPLALAAGDVDNDGVCDLLVGHGGGAVEVMPGRPPKGFGRPSVLESASDVVALGRGDFNADGQLDFVAVNRSTKNLSVFLGQAAGGFANRIDYALAIDPSAVAVGDWNRDGRSDVAVVGTNGSAGGLQIFLAGADGSLHAAAPVTVGTTPTAIDFGDLNGDGKPDLVIGDAGQTFVLNGNGDGTFQASAAIPNVGGATAVTVADFDRDGFNDIAVIQKQANASSALLLYGDGQGHFTSAGQPLGSGSVWSALAARDVNGDGVPELLVADQVNNAVLLFTRSGPSRVFVSAGSTTVNRMPTAVAAADFDGDGRYDAAALTTAAASTVSVLTTIGAPPVVRGDGNTDGAVTAADAVAVMRALAAGNGARLEQAQAQGPLKPQADANGDGVLSLQDVFAVAHRLFAQS